MLRLSVLILLLTNCLYFVWGHGYLQDYGFGPAQQTEPQRLAQQIKPEALRILNAAEAQRADEQAATPQASASTPAAASAAPASAAAAPTPKECLQAGPLVQAAAANVRKILESALPADAWQLQPAAARWIIYMGRYPNADALLKKRNELANMNLQFEAINNPALEPGLSLGAFATQAQANAELTRLGQRGIRTAKVVREFDEGSAFTLKLPALGAADKAKLLEAAPAVGKVLKSCVAAG